ncbi:5-methylthioribulose-1-phosphate/5-deoxyribulose-1-phosphate aldolase [Geodia barretti]|uniref:5-methylthioribulose-1-phosphate/5-deoxyribulose-1-phosphate aldolase n=1 Tax=Geodia barretti TaxID=519541 RepID=A0AA35TUK3_GEOBA|nr:5-methylthioribulose-1-phosphate/5-deoxyribulose-1-phosphate aldolase [Geodia barretti]
MNALGLNHGTSGNVGYRVGGRFLVTPSGLDYDAITPADIVDMDFDGSHQGTRRPTSEWRLHRDILTTRPEVDAVLHSHAVHCTALAVHGMEIPAVHLHGRRCGRHEHSLRALPDAHDPGALRRRRACAQGSQGLPVAESRRRRLGRDARCLRQSARRGRVSGGALLPHARHRRRHRQRAQRHLQRKMAEVLEIMKTYGKQPGDDPPEA